MNTPLLHDVDSSLLVAMAVESLLRTSPCLKLYWSVPRSCGGDEGITLFSCGEDLWFFVLNSQEGL